MQALLRAGLGFIANQALGSVLYALGVEVIHNIYHAADPDTAKKFATWSATGVCALATELAPLPRDAKLGSHVASALIAFHSLGPNFLYNAGMPQGVLYTRDAIAHDAWPVRWIWELSDA